MSMMDILSSTWLLKMLKKSGSSPRERLLVLFDILDDWVNAPHVRENLGSMEHTWEAPHALLEHLTEEAAASGVEAPEVLAQQLYFMALSMLREEERSPHSLSARHAKEVAKALIDAQSEKGRFIKKRSAYAMAASVFLITGITSLLLFSNGDPSSAKSLISSPLTTTTTVTSGAKPAEASPQQTAALFAAIEQMRKGECQYPEAIQLPDSQKAIYLTNVVAGQISSNAEDQALVQELIKKVRCNYTPMLMKNSVG